jgi:hypothetical protein
MSISNTGKKAEKLVEAVLKKWNNRSGFAYFRLPDSRAARNFLMAQPGDFAYYCGPRAGILEVKSTQHSYRLAKDKISQLPTLKKLSAAGAANLVLVNHTTEGVWRVLYPGGLDASVPSWDLRNVETYEDAGTALLCTGYFG